MTHDGTAGPPWHERPGEFDSDTERLVERTLVRLRQTQPLCDMTWVPNPRLRTQWGIVRPYFVVLSSSGRFGVLEVDGPSHRRKWALDRSKDMRLEDAGAAYVGRIDVAATNDRDELEAYLLRFVRRLDGYPRAA